MNIAGIWSARVEQSDRKPLIALVTSPCTTGLRLKHATLVEWVSVRLSIYSISCQSEQRKFEEFSAQSSQNGCLSFQVAASD